MNSYTATLRKFALILLVWSVSSTALAAIQLNILTNTSTEVVIEFSGTLDQDTLAIFPTTEPGYIGLKSNYSAFPETNTEWFDQEPSVAGQLLIGGLGGVVFTSDPGSSCWGDSVYWENPSNDAEDPILAGTTISGTITLTGANFDTDATALLQVVSGSDSSGSCDENWYRSETALATSVPTLPLWALGVLLGLVGYFGSRRLKG